MFSSEVLHGFISLWTISKQTHREIDVKSQWEGQSGAETTDVDRRKEKGQLSKSGSKRKETIRLSHPSDVPLQWHTKTFR